MNGLCARCGVSVYGLTIVPVRLYDGSVDYMDAVCAFTQPSALSMYCCNGKGGSRWDPNLSQWKCTDCGAIQSNDPNYLYTSTGRNKIEVPKGYKISIAPVSPKPCECGSEKVGSNKHSTWCPKHEK